MNRKLKIYLKTGIGFLFLFLASAVAVTWIQTANNRSDMERTLVSANELGREVVENIKQYNEKDDYSIDTFMWIINGKINGFVNGAWSNHNIYSSVILLDSNRQIVSRSGYMLQISQKIGIDDHWYIPFDVFCSDEQKDLLYRTFRSEIRGSGTTMVNGEISGFLDDLKQWIPQQITIYSKADESKKILLDFDIEPIIDGNPISYSFRNAIIWIPGPGTHQHTPTKTDKKLLKECDELAVLNIEKAVGYIEYGPVISSTNSFTHLKFDGVTVINIDDETYYLAIGGQGFPLRAVISELWVFYLYFFIILLILYWVVSRGFVKQYNRQLALEADRRTLTLDATVKLKDPLTVISNCGAELRQSVSDENRAELLDAIIGKTEQMDDIVRELLTSTQAERGEKDGKD